MKHQAIYFLRHIYWILILYDTNSSVYVDFHLIHISNANAKLDNGHKRVKDFLVARHLGEGELQLLGDPLVLLLLRHKLILQPVHLKKS